MEKFRNKYRIQSTRLQIWDYGWDATYYITICTQHQEFYFGDVISGIMNLSIYGMIAEQTWLQIHERFKNANLIDFIVMPNHVHGIITINNDSYRRDAINRVSTTMANQPSPILKKPGGITGHHNPMLHDNLSKIIRWYKGRTTFEIRKTISEFQWQPRFYENIIRNHDSFVKMQDYIINNPINWNDDEFFGIS